MPDDQRGDCVPACIASVLGVSLEAIPNPHDDNWMHDLQGACGRYGYSLAELDTKWDPPRGYWIASVPSLNLKPEGANGEPQYHAIVCKYLSFVHDPALEERYDDAKWAEAWNEGRVRGGWALTPLDPAHPNPGREPKADANNPQLTASEYLALAAKAMTEEERERLVRAIANQFEGAFPFHPQPKKYALRQARSALTALLGPAVQEEGR